MKEYLNLAERIIAEGEWVLNERTGKRCLTIINASLTYDVDLNKLPRLTTRHSPFKLAIAELIAYARGATSAKEFRELGAKSWDANANENNAWLNNPNRKGEDDVGIIYGAVGNAWPVLDYNEDGELYVSGKIDLLEKIYNNLKQGIDDRGETWSFWNPGMFHLGCLRPCMRNHTFSILNGTLYLTSEQRSVDTALGLVANQIQSFTLLYVMAKITGLKPGKAYHNMINVHIYEDQLELLRDVQLTREPMELPSLKIADHIKTLEDFRNSTPDDYECIGYQSHPKIDYPFSV